MTVKLLLLVALIGAISVAAALAYSARNSSDPQRGIANCPNDAAVARVEAATVYSDAQGSVVDPAKLRLHEQQILPLRNFVTDASRRADSIDPAERECALAMMLDWAKTKAMEAPPADFGGLRELERFGISLNIIALKLRADGLNTDPLLGWLGALNRIVIERFGTRDRVDNLYVWSGVAAASYALLGHDDVAGRYANDVWTKGVAAIRPDGFVDSELRRGNRALLYHVYDLSALMTLRAFRNALGESNSDQEQASLARLADRVGSSLCDPSSMASAAGSTTQEKAPAIEFAPIAAFAESLSGPRVLRCAPADIPKSDPILGGQFDKTVAILANFRNRARRR